LVIVRGFIKSKPNLAADSFERSLQTPQGALRIYQDAVRRRDLDAMVGARDFEHEATQLLRSRSAELAGDIELVAKTKETLEAAFRAEWRQRTWPDLSGATTFFSTPLPLSPNEVFVNELLRFPGGHEECSPVYLVRRGSEWRLFQAPT